jgi:hypothetical protein
MLFTVWSHDSAVLLNCGVVHQIFHAEASQSASGSKQIACHRPHRKYLFYGHRKLARGIRAAVRPAHERLALHEHLPRRALN